MARQPLQPRPISPGGLAALRAEYDQLFATERPGLVETIAWAAANGDRGENGDYLYGRKRLREIDRRLDRLSRLMDAARVIGASDPQDRTAVRFGATVELADEADQRRVVTIVGDDESDAGSGRIGWNAPLARALIGARVGDERLVVLPAGDKCYAVTAITYPDAD